MQTDPKQIVAAGYDRIVERHSQWAGSVRQEERARYTAVLLERLPSGAAVLELGCGAGMPTTQRLAGHFEVTGVDISAQQIARARQAVPAARFLRADMVELDFPPASFDAVAAFYALIHVPRHEQTALLQRVASWLRPGGLLVATMGAHSTEAGYEEDWLGVPMYWSSFDSETNQRMVKDAGLCIVKACEETADEFGEPVTFLWIVAEKPVHPGTDQAGGQKMWGMSSQNLASIVNFVGMSDTVGTAGQPTPEQFADIRAAGYEVVINLAMPDSTNALPNEDELVAEQGMDYVHIPVVWDAPRVKDLEAFFEAMARYWGRKILVHCALNWRVSCFMLLYRVIQQGVPLEEARRTLLETWKPNAIWHEFIGRSFARYGISGWRELSGRDADPAPGSPQADTFAEGAKMTLVVERMQAKDWPAVRVIYQQGIATGDATFETEVPTWEEWDRNHVLGCRLVARSQGKIVGWAALAPVSSRCVYGGVAEVSIYIAEGSRGLGVGKALLQALVEESERRGIWTLQAGIFPENRASIALHQRCGFRIVGRRERLGQLNGVWRDVVLMERRSHVVGI